MRYARILDDVVAEIILVPEGLTIGEMFHEDIVATLVKVGEDVMPGWIRVGPRSFRAPPEPELPPAPPVVLPASVLYERMTDDEFDAVDASVEEGESRRLYRAFTLEVEFREDGEMWALLVKHMGLVGVTTQRQAELLAPPPFTMLAIAQTE